MSKILYYIFFLFSFELVLSEEFQNYLGDNTISDDYPNTISRGIIPINDFAKLKIGSNQDIYVNLIAGNLIYKRLDYYLYDIGFPIVIEFTYNSGSSFKGRFGNQWQLSYNIRYVENNFNKNIILIENDDKSIIFEENKSIYTSNNPNYKIQKSENSIIIENFKDNHYKLDDYVRYNFISNIHNYISSIEDRNLNKINFTYNADKQLVSIKYPSGRNINFYYDNNLLSKISIPDYGNINYKYDDNKNLITVEYPNQNKIFYSYNENCGFLKKVINENDTVEIEYENNYLVKKLFKKNSEIEYEFQYDIVNKENRFIDKYNKEYQINYDSFFRTIKIKKFGVDFKSLTWDSLNRITNYRDPLNQPFSYTYFNDSKLIEYLNPENKRIKFSFEDKYRRLNKIDINNSKIEYDLDKNANILSVKKNGDLTKTIDYDNFGQIIKYKNVKDEYNILYDGLGNFKRIIINNDLEFSFEYNNLNYLTNLSEIGEFSISANYYTNRIDIINNYDKLSKSIMYNYQNRIDSIYDKDKIINRYYYDNSNRLIKFSQDSLFDIFITYKNDSTINITTPMENYSIINNYIEKTKQIRNNHLDEYKYDKLDRLTERAINGQNVVKYSYTSEFLLNKIMLPDISTIDISYDDFNRIIKLKKQGAKNYTYSWDNFDRLTNYAENSKIYAFHYFENSYSVELPSSKQINVLVDSRYKELSYLDFLYKYNYDRYGRIESIHRNNIEIYQAIYQGNLMTRKVINSQNEFQYSYNENFKLSEINQNNESLVLFNYDKYNRINKIDNNGFTVKYNYDKFNRISSINTKEIKFINLDYSNHHIIINNNNKDFKYDFINNNLIKVSNPNSDNIFINYSNFIYPNRIVAPEGVYINLEFNNINKLKSIIDYYGNKTQFNYDENENIVSLFNKNSLSRGFNYNVDNKIIEYIDLDGGKFRINYNDFLLPSKIVLKNSDSVNYQYDNNLFIKEFRNYNGSKVYFDYDNYGNLIKLNDINDTIIYEYNKDNSIFSTKYDDKFITKYNYKNSFLNQININDSLKMDVTYDEFNKLNKLIFNDINILNLTKDNYGNIIYQQIWQNRPSLFTYNYLGLIEEQKNEINRKFNHDKLGRIIQITSNVEFKENLNYDYNSRIISREDINKNSFSYNYDKMNNIILISRNVLDSIKFVYTNLNKISSVKLNNKEIFSLDYQDFLVKSINNNDINIELKWLDFNYKNLLIKKNDYQDTLSFDLWYRQSKKSEPVEYQRFGLIEKKAKQNLIYDDYFRLTKNENLSISNINYDKLSFSPNSFQINNNNFKTRFNLSNKLSDIIYQIDTIKIIDSQFSNLITLEKNKNKIFDYYYDGLGNFKYYFAKLDIFLNDYTYNFDYGFERNKINMEYYYNKNLKSVNLNRKSLLKFEYDDFGNIILNEDSEGNLVQFSYKNNNINEINHSNGKFIRILHDESTNQLIGAYSNSTLSDSISFINNNENFLNKSLTYFEDKFRIYKDSDDYLIEIGNRNYKLFNYNKKNRNFKINNYEHNYIIDSGFTTNIFSIQYLKQTNNIKQNINLNNFQINIDDELNIFNNLTNSIINSDTIIHNRFDELNRLIFTNYSSKNSFIYNAFNKLSKHIIDTDTLIYDYTDNSKIKINEKNYILNSNRSISKIIDGVDTTLIFYDFADRISNMIKKESNIHLFYNSMGELSAIIDKDTSYYLNFSFDSINVSIIFNKSKNQLDLYFRKTNDNQFPIIKYDFTNNKIRYLIRNVSGYPSILIDENNTHTVIKGNYIFGARPNEINDFAYYFKDYLFIDQIGLLYDNGKFVNPENNLQYNNFAQNYLEELSSLNSNNLFKVKNSIEKDSNYISLNLDDIIEPIDPIDNQFIDIINKNKQEFIKDEINTIFNNFKVFNLDLFINKENELNFEDKADLTNYLPNLNKVMKSFDCDLKLIPIFPFEITDSVLIKNLKSNEIFNPEFTLERKDKFNQIRELLIQSDIESNFILFDKINDLENIYDKIEITYPNNIIELQINTVDIQDINQHNNTNSLIKNLSRYQNSNNEQNSILSKINSYLYKKSPDNFISLNKPYLLNSDLIINENLINNYLPFNLDIIEQIPVDNINKIIKLITVPYPKYYFPSLHLYDNNHIQIPLKNNKIDVLGKFMIQKYFNEVK